MQKTIGKVVHLEGKALFSGREVMLSLRPAPVGTGVVFRRVDQGMGEGDALLIPARLEYVHKTDRCTSLMREGEGVFMVEHLLSVLHVFGVNNLFIDLDGPELPIGDGSALCYLDLIEEGGVETQEASLSVRTLDRPLFYSEGEATIVALPSDHLSVSYTLHYPGHPLLEAQVYSARATEERFKEEMVACRTFSLHEEVEQMKARGLLLDGGLDNGVVIDGGEVLNKEGLRCHNEMARHKTLDILGDLFLVGVPFHAQIIALRTGHRANIALGRKIVQSLENTQ